MKTIGQPVKDFLSKIALFFLCATLLGIVGCGGPSPTQSPAASSPAAKVSPVTSPTASVPPSKPASPSPSSPAASPMASPKPVVSTKYPNLKWGVMTSSLSKFLSPTVENVTKIIDFAAAQGFGFIELRDTLNLNVSNCTDIAAYAKKKNIEVIYSVGNGTLEATYLDTLPKWISNAKTFTGPPVIRTASGISAVLPANASDTSKVAMTADDFNKIVGVLNKAGDLAKAAGLQLLVENGGEKLQGDGTTTFGFADLFGSKGVNATVGLQIDTGNFFINNRAPASNDDIKAFFDKNVSRVGYMHVKTSKDNKQQSVMGESQLPHDYFLSTCSKAGKTYMAIELDSAAATTLDDMYNNYIKSIDYLQKNF